MAMSDLLITGGGRTWLPQEFMRGHELAFLLHDVLGEVLRSAEQQGLLIERMPLRDDADRDALEAAGDVFEWLETTGRTAERAQLFRRAVVPAVLSDSLHFIYEALESSRKAKLTVAYSLLRKPLQENLFILESIALDLDGFAQKFVSDVLGLRSQKSGGVEVHARRIRKLLDILGAGGRFDADYIAQLRYDKDAEDGFDGACNQATHLITSKDQLRTDKMNLNFVFSGWDAKKTQWSFFYSRLPYLLAYWLTLTEHIYSKMSATDPVYLGDIARRQQAATVLWARTLRDPYLAEPLARFGDAAHADLLAACHSAGWREPSERDLLRMRATGAWPGEPPYRVHARHIRYSALAAVRRLRARVAAVTDREGA